MIREMCNSCRNPHFNNLKCSKCGVKYSSIWPRFHQGSATAKEWDMRIKYCPLCGHKFKKCSDKQ